MAKYTKKPVTIEAMLWDGKNTTEILKWMFPDLPPDATASDLTIKTLEGEMKASVGDFIIRGVKGEFYPCKPDIFEQTYRPAIDEPNKVFKIKDSNNIIISVINAPAGEIQINSSFTIVKDGIPQDTIPLGHALFEGNEEQILHNVILAAASVLVKGRKKNEKKIIVPDKTIIT